MSDASSDGLWTRRLTFEGGLSLTVQEEWGVGIGGTVWEGGVLLARYLASPAFVQCRLPDLPAGGRAIELGAGVTGLPTLVAAALAATTGALAEIVTSDVEECLEGLAAAVRDNAPQGSTIIIGGGGGGRGRDGGGTKTREEDGRTDGWDLPRSVIDAIAGEADDSGRLVDPAPPVPPPRLPDDLGGGGGGGDCGSAGPRPAVAALGGGDGYHHHHPVTIRVLDLDWARVPALVSQAPAGGSGSEGDEGGGLGGPFDLVLIADAVYHAPSMPALVAALRALAPQPGAPGAVLLAFYERSRPAAEVFWPRLRAAFDVTHIPAASFGCAGADAPAGSARADGSVGPPTGVFDLVKVSDEEYARREAARVRAEEEAAAEDGGEGEAEKSGGESA